MIHNIFDAEILKINCSSRWSTINGWWTEIDTICMVNGNQFRPDVGGWNPKPTLDQRRTPIISSNPPPLLWIETKILFLISKAMQLFLDNRLNQIFIGDL
ncbi:6189_t:CDS:2 [Ambispora leptoticha]|uniref:6189_t:CDS:1 n=1 Tax=Ambispora leptoticha TaxID=144679 RepID=A0A9N8VTD3_9GLOM|nr:6189_t:CDS:2 [Ambispora leptoticha]